jgi:hypothetical protein
VIGLTRRYRTDVYGGAVSGPNPPVASAIRQIFGRYRPEIYRFYVSHTQSEAGEAGADERAIDKRGNVLLRPLMLISPLIIGGLLWWGIAHLWHASAKYRHGSEAGEPGGRGPPPSPGGLTTLASRPAPVAAAGDLHLLGGVQSVTWHVVGYVLNHANPAASVAMVKSSAGQRLPRPFDHCRVIVGEPLQCELEGIWYSETGLTADAGVHGPIPSGGGAGGRL